MVRPVFHPVKLMGLTDRAKKIIKYYFNSLILQEYNELGVPLNIHEGKPAIFCISPDSFWNGWFILDEDVRFEAEYSYLIDVLKDAGVVREKK